MKEIEKAINWFENIADGCDKITSGNVAHLRAQVKGMAIRSAEYLKKHSQEPASEDLEQAAYRYGEQHLTYKDDDGYWIDTQGPTADAFKAGAQWQREQMMKDAIDTRIDKRLADMIGYTGSERVKVIIIKE